MKKDHQVILTGVLQFLFGGILSVGAFLVCECSACYPLSVESWIEILQEALLVLSTIFFSIAAVRSPQYGGGILLLAGLTFAFFIREMDGCLDLVFHGAWKYVLILCFPFYLYFQHKLGWRTIIPGIAHYIRSRSFMMFLPGSVIILVFSRLFGSKYLWLLYLPANVCIKKIKNFRSLSEESIELLGYAIIFGASLIAAYATKKKKE